MRELAGWCVRLPIGVLACWTPWFRNLVRRTRQTEIDGRHLKMIDRRKLAVRFGLKPLNRFELWLMKYYIQDEIKRAAREELLADLNFLSGGP